MCGANVAYLFCGPQGDGHGSVWRLGAAELVLRGGPGTPVRNNRTAVFHIRIFYSHSCRGGDAGAFDERSLLRRLSRLFVVAPLVGGTKRNALTFILVIAYHSENVEKHEIFCKYLGGLCRIKLVHFQILTTNWK